MVKDGDKLKEKTTELLPDIDRALSVYGNSLYRLCVVMLKNREDAEDAVQDCFLRYITKATRFSDSEHEKAWLIRVATNICNDTLRSRKKQSFLSLDEIRDLGTSEDNVQILGLLTSLEEKYRIVIHLHYVEGYGTEEIADLLKISQAAVRKRMQRGRDMLREIYEREGI